MHNRYSDSHQPVVSNPIEFHSNLLPGNSVNDKLSHSHPIMRCAHMGYVPVLSFIAVILTQVPLGTAAPALTPHQRYLLHRIKAVHQLPTEQLQQLKALFSGSPLIGQGSPASVHPVSKQQCLQQTQGISPFDNSEYQKICGARFMAPIVDQNKQLISCIDQFEFPNIPCEYPVVWTRSLEAHQICQAMGKRLCDADEWESACAGQWQEDRGNHQTHQQQRHSHNTSRQILWAYGPQQQPNICATNSEKSSQCDQALKRGHGIYTACGSNTYPSGYFPLCKSKTDVYDQHGNAAEHMNLPLQPQQKTRFGGVGVTEMKGSWFVFSKYPAYPDDCRWRAPFWHGSAVDAPHSHQFYHLGFRCCKSISPPNK